MHRQTAPALSLVCRPLPAENKHYPNPPGWGLSYHVNGEESPVLEVVRGTTYTFRGKRQLGPAYQGMQSSSAGAVLPGF